MWQERRRDRFPLSPAKSSGSHTTRRQTTKAEPLDLNPQPGIMRDLKNRIRHFCTEVTTAHGFPHIYNYTNRVARLIWILIVLVGLGAVGWQMSILIRRYLEFGVNTEVSSISKYQFMTTCFQKGKELFAKSSNCK